MLCKNCGKEIKDESKFCTVCGAENPMPDTHNTIIPDTETSIINSVVSKKKIFIIIFAVLIVLISLGAVLYVTVFNSVEALCEKGEYQKAYEKADEDERIDVYYENVAAVVSADCISDSYDPDTYVLSEVYYDDSLYGSSLKAIVMRASGNNTLGRKVSQYIFYVYGNTEEKGWQFMGACNSDFDEKEIYDDDDDDEIYEKEMYNLMVEMLEYTVNNGTKLDKQSVERINNHFKEGRLDEIELIDID